MRLTEKETFVSILADAPAPSSPPSIDGWPTVTGAINSMRSFEEPMALAITSPDFGTLWIDFPRSRYYIDRPLSSMPAIPRNIGLFSQQLVDGEELFPWVQWEPIDALLWWMARAAFGGQPAAWRRPTDRYRIIRWPNLTQLPHTATDIRVLAALSSGQELSAEEAAVLAAAPVDEVQVVINALSLAGGLDTNSAAIAPPAAVAAATERAQAAGPRPGLFGRLRARLTGGARG